MPPNATTRFAPHRARLTKLKAKMRKQDLDHMLVTDPRDVAYLTGFLGGDSPLLVGGRKAMLISDSRYEEDLKPFSDLCTVRMRSGKMSDEIAAVLGEIKPDKVGLQSESFTIDQHTALRKAARSAGFKAASLTPVSSLITSLRRVKDDSEVKKIRKAIKIQEEALTAIRDSIKPGRTEQAITADLEAEMKSRGSSKPAFDTIVGARANSSRPHHSVSATSVTLNRPVLVDWGGTYEGYHSDMTRTFAMGAFSTRMEEIYTIVLDAHELAADALKAGVLARDVDAVARDHITAAGYGENFGHGLGHGIGLQIHEAPSLGKLSGDAKLEAGNVVTIEPGIYLPGTGGVRLEDDYLVTATGAKRLSTLPKDLDWATL